MGNNALLNALLNKTEAKLPEYVEAAKQATEEAKAKGPVVIEVNIPESTEVNPLLQAVADTAKEMEVIRAGRSLGEIPLNDEYWPAETKHRQAWLDAKYANLLG